MQTIDITAHPDNDAQIEAIKTALKGLKIKFEISKEQRRSWVCKKYFGSRAKYSTRKRIKSHFQRIWWVMEIILSEKAQKSNERQIVLLVKTGKLIPH